MRRPVRLRGLAWDHPRAVDPLLAATAEWSEPGVDIRWDRRSLRAFGEQPLERVVRDYDLLLVDHPHIAGAATAGQLRPFDALCDPADLARLAAESVGPSHRSYSYAGRQWALAIDAAAQVAVYRPDRLPEPPRTWAEVERLATRGQVLWPTAGFASFLTLAASLGFPVGLDRDALIGEEAGVRVLDLMHRLAGAVPSWCVCANPVEVLECLSTSDEYAYSPLLFGFVSYSHAGFRPHRLKFVDLPSHAPATAATGSCLGGAGIAVSRHSRHPEPAARFAVWCASAECQAGVYLQAGGQPGNARAWYRPEANATTGSFFAGTWRTLQLSYVRPQHPGWMDVQRQSAADLTRALRGELTDREALARMNARFRQALAPGGS